MGCLCYNEELHMLEPTHLTSCLRGILCSPSPHLMASIANSLTCVRQAEGQREN